MGVAAILVTVVTILLLLGTNDDKVKAMQIPIPDVGQKIVGGRHAKNNEFPYQVLLSIKGNLCGGSIIDNAHVLTAAHCVVNNKKVTPVKYVKIYAGHIIQHAGIKYNAKYIFTHEKYSEDDVKNDIALIRVSKNFTFTNAIQPIHRQLSTPPQTSKIPCNVTGWGVERYGNTVSSPILQVVEIPLFNISTCRSHFQNRLKDGMICAGDLYKDACQGDSGGPLTCNGLLTGIVSWGDDCGKLPGVYTSVSYYRDWINTQIQRSSCSHNLLSIHMLIICLAILITSHKLL